MAETKRFEVRPDNKAGLTYEIIETLNGILIAARISDKEDAEIMCDAMNASDSPNESHAPVVDAEKLADKLLDEKQQRVALLTMRFQLSEVKNFEDMVNGLGQPSTYTEDDVKMYIRTLKDNAESFFKHSGLSETE